MAHKDIEIEIKLPLKNPDDVKKFLNENAKLVSENIYQKDTYYFPVHKNFLKVKYPFEWLRLRKSPKGEFITYKHFYPENAKKTDYCDEFESKIENIESMEKIFKSLDIQEAVMVEKIRTTWIYKDIEIVVDYVTDLGYYIELETTTHFKNPKDGKKYLFDILKKLNINTGEEDLRGYPYILLEKNSPELLFKE